jgi:hypothetical protein
MVSKTRTSKANERPLRWTVIAVAALAGLAAADAAAADPGRGTCVSVRLEAPVVLPDGGVYPAGSLRICDAVSFSPVTSLHAISVDGQAVGLMASHRKRSEAGADVEPSVLFERDTRGRLRLVGYVMPSHGSSISYAMAMPTPADPEAAIAVARGVRPLGWAAGLVAMSR